MDWLLPLERIWENGYEHARRYYEKNGDLRVSTVYKDEDGFFLGQWLRRQIKDREKLSPSQITRLNTVGMIWNQAELRYKAQSMNTRIEAV